MLLQQTFENNLHTPSTRIRDLLIFKSTTFNICTPSHLSFHIFGGFCGVLSSIDCKVDWAFLNSCHKRMQRIDQSTGRWSCLRVRVELFQGRDQRVYPYFVGCNLWRCFRGHVGRRGQALGESREEYAVVITRLGRFSSGLQQPDTYEYNAPLVPPISFSATVEMAITEDTTSFPLTSPLTILPSTATWMYKSGFLVEIVGKKNTRLMLHP
jgi:hypothetical protein